MKKEGLLSIILPAFNEEKIIKKAANVIGSILNGASIPYGIFIQKYSVSLVLKL